MIKALFAIGALVLAMSEARAIELNSEQFRADTAAVVRKHGYTCPRVQWIVPIGEDHYGLSARVQCGLNLDETGFYQLFEYKVTLRANRAVMVVPLLRRSQ